MSFPSLKDQQPPLPSSYAGTEESENGGEQRGRDAGETLGRQQETVR